MQELPFCPLCNMDLREVKYHKCSAGPSAPTVRSASLLYYDVVLWDQSFNVLSTFCNMCMQQLMRQGPAELK